MDKISKFQVIKPMYVLHGFIDSLLIHPVNLLLAKQRNFALRTPYYGPSPSSLEPFMGTRNN